MIISQKWLTILFCIITFILSVLAFFSKLNVAIALISIGFTIAIVVPYSYRGNNHGIIYKGERKKDDSFADGVKLSFFAIMAMAFVAIIIYIIK